MCGPFYFSNEKSFVEVEIIFFRSKKIGGKTQGGVSHDDARTVSLPFTLKSISRKKKSYGNSNISPCKNITFKKRKKTSTRNQNPSRFWYKLISSFNKSQNIIFQKSPISK
jgi:hypothetical protein